MLTKVRCLSRISSEVEKELTEEDFTTSTQDYIDVRKRLIELGCSEPDGIAILPTNLESANSIADLRMPMEAMTIRKLLLEADLPCDDVASGDVRISYVINRSFDPTIPVLFMSAALVWENQDLLFIALDKIAAFTTDILIGGIKEKNVELEIVIEEPEGSCKKVSYTGPAGSLKEVVSVIRELKND